MEILMLVFGVFAAASAAALIRFEGNPLFAFTLLLSLASLVWLWNLARQEAGGNRKPRRKKRGRH